jgi:hypothetical protein
MPLMIADKTNVMKIAPNVRVDATTPPFPTRRCLPGLRESSRALSQRSIGRATYLQVVHAVPDPCAAVLSSICQAQQGVQQHIGTILDLIPLGEFSR